MKTKTKTKSNENYNDPLWAGKPSWYVTSHLAQLSLSSLQVGKSSTSLSGWG